MLYLTGGLVLGETAALWMTGKGVLFGLALAPAVFLLFCRRRCARPAFFALLTVTAGWILGMLCMEGKSFILLKAETVASEIYAQDRKNKCGLTGTVESQEKTKNGEKWVLKNCRVEWKDSERENEEQRDEEQRDGGWRDQKEQAWERNKKQVLTVPGKVLCYVDSESMERGGIKNPGKTGFNTADLVRVEGTISPVKPPGNPGEYNFRLACFAGGTGCQFYGDTVTVLSKRPLKISGYLRLLREQLGERLESAAEPKDAGILKAVLLGDRQDLDPEIYDLYRRNGISHLLAISGLHMSVIGMGLWKLLRKTGCARGVSGVLAGGTLILYGIMTGGSPSVFRAVFMLLLSFLADWLGRTYDLASALSAAAFCLLVTEPFLLTQAAFQLSFLAVSGIVFLGQPLIRLLSSKNIGAAPQAFLISLSVQAATLPAILYHSFEIPVYGIFLNLLVIPPMAGVLYSGLAAMAFSGIWGTAAVFCLGGGHFILLFYEWICEQVQEFPGAVWCIGRPGMWQILIYYGLIFGGVKILLVYHKQKRPDKAGRAGFCMMWLCAFLALLPVKRGGLTVTFLDVGQGDGIFLEGENLNLLVDCGSSQNRNLGEYSLVPFLKSRGITELDTAVVTHGDRDHISGIQYLLENPGAGIRIERLLMPEAGTGQEIYLELEKQAAENGVRTAYIGRGDRIAGKTDQKGIKPGGITAECLYPSEETVCRDRNDESAVLLLTYGRFRLLLTGDLEETGEQELLKRGDLKPVTILKAGHHGSKTSSGPLFLEVLSPAETILSYGEGNRYGHPAYEVMERLRECGSGIWETAKSGAVEVWTDGERMEIRGYRKRVEKAGGESIKK